MNLIIPVNFGERQCDRMLLSKLRTSESNAEWRSYLLWMMLQVWRDFAIARDDRRLVPKDERARRQCDAVLILEEYCGWNGDPGKFVQAAIDCGFFQLVSVDAENSELVLVDFFPANHAAAREITSSKLGGISKSINIARRAAQEQSTEQLGLFERTNDPVLKEHGKDRVMSALFLVCQICRILGWKSPESAQWRDSLTVKALAVLDSTTELERELACKWFVANRKSQEIPTRIDFVLDKFGEFVTKAHRDFGSVS